MIGFHWPDLTVWFDGEKVCYHGSGSPHVRDALARRMLLPEAIEDPDAPDVVAEGAPTRRHVESEQQLYAAFVRIPSADGSGKWAEDDFSPPDLCLPIEQIDEDWANQAA